jgi:hypothetical protein
VWLPFMKYFHWGGGGEEIRDPVCVCGRDRKRIENSEVLEKCTALLPSRRFRNTELGLKKISCEFLALRMRSADGCREQGKEPSGSVEVRVCLLKEDLPHGVS